MLEGQEIGVVAGPLRVTTTTIRSKKMAHDVAVRIEHADFRNALGTDILLSARLPEQSVRRED